MTVILFIVVLLVCVLVHEWGHFIVAKKSGMLVEEFGFGIPPKLFSWKRGETTYSINALPIGGFVKIAGENGADESIPRERQFDSKPWYLKSLVLVAGVIMNFLLAVVLFTGAYTIGMPGITPDGTPTIVSVVAGSPAQAGALKSGDRVQSVFVDGTKVDTLTTEAIHSAIVESDGPVVINVLRGDERTTVSITPEGEGDMRMIGLAIEPIGVVKLGFFDAVGQAWTQSVDTVHSILSTLGALVAGIFTHNGASDGLVGPVGLAREVGNAATFGLTYLLAFVALISLNLAVLNIVPFPALDGGRLLVVWCEAITGRKLSPTVTGIIHGLGFLILIGLMIVLTIGDIRKAL